jgi:hypothetical protein
MHWKRSSIAAEQILSLAVCSSSPLSLMPAAPPYFILGMEGDSRQAEADLACREASCAA